MIPTPSRPSAVRERSCTTTAPVGRDAFRGVPPVVVPEPVGIDAGPGSGTGWRTSPTFWTTWPTARLVIEKLDEVPVKSQPHAAAVAAEICASTV